MPVEDDCPICLHPLRTEGERCQCLPCGHSFHEGCIVRMRLNNGPSQCPLCRLQCPELEGPEQMYNNVKMLYSQHMYEECFKKCGLLVDLVPDGYGDKAMGHMVNMCVEGKVGEQYLKMAFNLFARNHDKGSVVATTFLAQMLDEGLGCERNMERCFNLMAELWEKDKGDVGVALYLALNYRVGDVCERDLEKAFNLFTQCHNEGDMRATTELSIMFYEGQGCEQNFTRAFELLTEAHDKGDDRNTLLLASMCYDGRGCERDLERAFNLATQARDKGHPGADVYLANMYKAQLLAEENYWLRAEIQERTEQLRSAQLVAPAPQLLEQDSGAGGEELQELCRLIVEQNEALNQQNQRLKVQMERMQQSLSATQQQEPTNRLDGQCPTTGWQYIDPNGVIQGPYTLLEMQVWHSMGYLRPTLRMRCDPNDAFAELSALFPSPMVPFESYPRRSVGLATLDVASAVQEHSDAPCFDGSRDKDDDAILSTAPDSSADESDEAIVLTTRFSADTGTASSAAGELVSLPTVAPAVPVAFLFSVGI